jgi:gliding motility-associated-like protein
MAIEPLNPQHCEGDSLFLNLSGADNYEWLEADGLSALDGPNVWVSPDTTTVYSVIASTEECLDTIDVTVTVVPYPILMVDPVYATSCNDPIELFATGAFQLAWTPVETLSNGYGPFTTATPTETTTYTVTGTNQGCSSTETVTIAYQVEIESTEYFCEGEGYSLPDGSDVTEEGTYIANYVSVEGCDSIVTVNLFEQSTYDFQMPVQLCAGETFTLSDGTIIDSPGTYPLVLETAIAQCDSAVTAVVSVLEPFETQNILALCEGEPIELGDGTVVSEEGVYVTVLSSLTSGCDSTITSNVIFQPNYDISVSLSECNDGSYLFPDGSLPTNSGTFDFDLQTYLGCDSSVTIDLTFNPVYNISYTDQSCAGAGYTLPDGSEVDASGSYTTNLISSSGCDSVITVDLVMNPLPEVSSGAEDSYCMYDGDINLFPSPSGGELIGDVLDGNTLIHNDAVPGDYFVAYTIVDNNGCSNTDAVDYTLAAPIEPTFTFEMICNELNLVSNTPDPDESYEYAWFLGGDLVALFAEATYFFDQTGTFDLGLTVTDEYGCSFSETSEAFLQNTLDLSDFLVPNVISPNGDDFNQSFIIPSTVAACLNYNVDIFNRWGQLVYTMNSKKSAFQGLDENENELPEGTYFYVLNILEYPCNETLELQKYCTGTIEVFRN